MTLENKPSYSILPLVAIGRNAGRGWLLAIRYIHFGVMALELDDAVHEWTSILAAGTR